MSLFTFGEQTIMVRFGPDTPYDGAEVALRREASLGLALTLERQVRSRDATDVESAMRTFAGSFILSWNLATAAANGEQTPIPVTVDAFLGLPAAFVVALMQRWTAAITGVPGPLEQLSSNGSGPLEPSMIPAAW